MLSGVATTFALFFISRILLGAAGQLYNPPASSLLADYYPGAQPRQGVRHRAGRLLHGTPGRRRSSAASLAEAVGWRAVFFIVAVPGVLVAALVLTVREPLRGLGDRIDQLRGGDRHRGAAHGAPDRWPTAARCSREARELLQIRALRGVIAGLALLYLGLGGLFYWLPTLLERIEGLDYDAAAGLAGGVGGTGIVIGIILGSRIGDRGHGVKPAWRLRVALGFLLLGAIAPDRRRADARRCRLRMTLIALACVGFAGAIPNLTAASADVVPGEPPRPRASRCSSSSPRSAAPPGRC